MNIHHNTCPSHLGMVGGRNKRACTILEPKWATSRCRDNGQACNACSMHNLQHTPCEIVLDNKNVIQSQCSRHVFVSDTLAIHWSQAQELAGVCHLAWQFLLFQGQVIKHNPTVALTHPPHRRPNPTSTFSVNLLGLTSSIQKSRLL